MNNNNEEFIQFVKDNVQKAKDAMKAIYTAADGIDGNVAFLAIHEYKQMDRIANCAEIKGTVPNLDSVAEDNGRFAKAYVDKFGIS